MINVLLYIYDDVTGEPQRIELFDDERISVTSNIQNVNDISKVFTDFSQSFTVPATPYNNKIFKHWYENAIDNGFDARTRKDAYIELDYSPFRKGKIQLEKASYKNGVIDNYQITFFGSLVSAFSSLSSTTLAATGFTAFFTIFSVIPIKPMGKLLPKTFPKCLMNPWVCGFAMKACIASWPANAV